MYVTGFKLLPEGSLFKGLEFCSILAKISLGSETEESKIYYTTDGGEPTEKSTLYTNPFQINRTTEIKFYAEMKGLLSSTVVTARIEKLDKVATRNFKNYEGGNFKPGLQYKYYEENVLYVDEFDAFEPKKNRYNSEFQHRRARK